MSASTTNYIVNNDYYDNKDLNTIFSPIGRGSVDYGTFDNGTYVGTGLSQSFIARMWCLFKNPIRNVSSAGNVSVIGYSATNGGAFQINTAGFYRLNIVLFFTGGPDTQETYQKVLFILNSSRQVPSTANPAADLSVTFTPSPNMGQIYIMNCSGAASTDNANLISNLNNHSPSGLSVVNPANLLSNLNQITNVGTNAYYFAFLASSDRTNIYTLDITFNATAGQIICPQIVCQGFGDYNVPQNTLNGTASKWAFFKL